MVTKTKDTDVLPIEDKMAKTDAPVDTDDKAPVEQVNETHNNTIPSKTDEEVLRELANISQDEESKKPTRKEATIEKEARRLEESIIGGEIDFDILSKKISNTPIGQEALKRFAEASGYDIREIQQGLSGSNENTRLQTLEEEIKRLKMAEEERTSNKETQSFLSFYKERVASYDITPVEFDSLYGDEYKTIFSKYANALGQKEAANIAFEMTIGKDKEAQARIDEVKKRVRNKENAISLKPTIPRSVPSNKLMTLREVSQMSDADRAAYKKAHWNKTENRAMYLD
jgi:hypothetical protein